MLSPGWLQSSDANASPIKPTAWLADTAQACVLWLSSVTLQTDTKAEVLVREGGFELGRLKTASACVGLVARWQHCRRSGRSFPTPSDTFKCVLCRRARLASVADSQLLPVPKLRREAAREEHLPGGIWSSICQLHLQPAIRQGQTARQKVDVACQISSDQCAQVLQVLAATAEEQEFHRTARDLLGDKQVFHFLARVVKTWSV